jgi:predicted nuclease with TOPRIM domain
LKKPRSEDVQASRSHPSNERYARIQSENEQLRNQLADFKAAYFNIHEVLTKSKTHRAQLNERLEEATATIFQLRPQRQEHTESEIQGDFYKLSESIKNCIEMNCDGFLEDN